MKTCNKMEAALREDHELEESPAFLDNAETIRDPNTLLNGK